MPKAIARRMAEVSTTGILFPTAPIFDWTVNWTVTDRFYNSAVFTAAIGGGPTTLLATPAGGLSGGPSLSISFGRIAVDAQ